MHRKIKNEPSDTVYGYPHTSSLNLSIQSLLMLEKSRVFRGIFWLLCTNAATLIFPSLLNKTFHILESNQTLSTAERNNALSMIALQATLLALFAAIVRILSRRDIFQVGRNIEAHLRIHVFQHIALLSSQQRSSKGLGEWTSHLTNDLSNIRLMTGFALLNAINTVVFFVGTIPLILQLHSSVALWSLMPFVLIIVIASLGTRRMFKQTQNQQKALAQLTQQVTDTLQASTVLRMYGALAFAQTRFEKRSEELSHANMALAMVRMVLFPLLGALGASSVALCLFLGSKAVIAQEMSLGDVLEMSTRLLQLTWPTLAMGFLFSVWQRGKAALQKVRDILDMHPAIVDGTVTTCASVETNILHAENVTLSVKLHNISFAIQTNQLKVLVGQSGSGKSLLLTACIREWDLTRGTLSLNGISSADYTLSEWSHSVKPVLDDRFLFSDTIAENVRFGRPTASDQDILHVLEQVDFSHDLTTMPQGIHTLVGERGVLLSGGQRQRIALARALLAPAKFLVIDDCFSAVDTVTEEKIIRMLRHDYPHLGLLIATNRLTICPQADEILVLQDGTIKEQGCFTDLLKNQEGSFSQLWNHQGNEEHSSTIENTQEVL